MKARIGDRLVFGGRPGVIVDTSRFRVGEPPFYVLFNGETTPRPVIPGLDTVIEPVDINDLSNGRRYPRKAAFGEPTAAQATAMTGHAGPAVELRKATDQDPENTDPNVRLMPGETAPR